MRPKYITRADVPEPVLAEEKEKIKQSLPADKLSNPKTLEFIVNGKLKKFYEDNVFVDMEYILDDEEGVTVGSYIKKLEKLMQTKGANISIGRTLSLSVK